MRDGEALKYKNSRGSSSDRASPRTINTVNRSIEGRMLLITSINIYMETLVETSVNLWTIVAVKVIDIIDLITIIIAILIIGERKELTREINSNRQGVFFYHKNL